MEPKYDKPVKGYGKRPMWRWVVIYLVAAVIVYGVVYYFFIRKTGNVNSDGSSSSGSFY